MGKRQVSVERSGHAGGAALGSGSAMDTGRSAADEFRSSAEGLGERAREESERVAGKAKSRADRGREEIAEEVGTVVHHLRESASELRARDAWLASVIGRGADELGGLARSLKSRDLDDIIGSLDQFARRQPGLFMGAAVGIGFALTRLAKSTAGTRHAEQPESGPPASMAATSSPVTPTDPSFDRGIFT